MRCAHQHQPAHVTVRRDVAQLRLAPRAHEAGTSELGVAGAEGGGGGGGQPSGETHEH
jgi:hypothetical protein